MEEYERLLPLEGGRNFRDLGGYKTVDGRTVKWRKIFRSGVMHKLTEKDHAYLSELGIKTICDFRAADERKHQPTDWKAAGVTDYVVFPDPADNDISTNPMFKTLMNPDATPEDVRKGMAKQYVQIAYDHVPNYTQMFDRLAAGDIPLAFNCSAGKDRAGTSAALVLTALGVPRETVVHDYSLSETYVNYMEAYFGDDTRNEVRQYRNKMMQAFYDMPLDKVAPLLESNPIYIESSFAALDEKYGSVMNFIQTELDVTDEALNAIRSALLE